MPRATNLMRCRLCGALWMANEMEGRYCLVCTGRVRAKPSDRARKRQRQRARQRTGDVLPGGAPIPSATA